jgi:hypothetical protein
VPASVTVAAGASSTSFNAQASAVSTTESVTLTAAAAGVSQTDVLQLLGTSGPQPPLGVQLTWDAPSQSSDPVVGYHVYRATSATSNLTLLSSSLDTQTSYTDNSVQAGVTYDYVVKSVDSNGVESAPSNTTVIPVP